MGVSEAQTKASETVDQQLASVLPSDGKPWYRKTHLLRLNFIVLSLCLLCESWSLRGPLSPNS
jgi:hypothetical protein